MEPDLKDRLNKFWEVESLGSAESSVIQQFKSETKFNGEPYVTKLPFRQGHDSLPSNFFLCKQRVNNLKGRLDRENTSSWV